MAKRSQTVSRIVRDLHARMAQKFAQRALKHIEYDRYCEAENAASWAEMYYDKAGANASRWRTV